MKALDELRDWVRSPIYRIASNSYTFAAERYEQLGAIIDEIETELAERYMELPVDADGVPIKVGDVVKRSRVGGGFCEPGEVVGFMTYGAFVWPIDEHNTTRNPDFLHHHHEPTVEDVLEEFAQMYIACNDKGTIAEYAAKLRLAGEGE